MDASGTGKNFVAAQMAPSNDDTQQFTIQLPAGTKCAGGTNQNLCLASITTTSGLGNCIVVSQAADAVDTGRSLLNAGRANDVRSGVRKRKSVKGPASADASAKGDKTGLRKGNRIKNDKNKAVTRHNQRITGKRLCKFSLFCTRADS